MFLSVEMKNCKWITGLIASVSVTRIPLRSIFYAEYILSGGPSIRSPRKNVRTEIFRFSYPGAFFSGETGPWENAFQRFLQISPRSVNDRIALREVVDLLKTGVRYMSPRGLVALVNAAEVRDVDKWICGIYKVVFQANTEKEC